MDTFLKEIDYKNLSGQTGIPTKCALHNMVYGYNFHSHVQ